MVFDSHIHVVVPEITRQYASDEDWRPRIFWENGSQIIEYAGKKIKSAVREFVHIDGILEANLEAGVDRLLLCPWVSLLRYDFDLDEGLRISRIQNEGLAKLAQAHPGKVYALGTVPMQDPEQAARELEMLMKEPSLYGIEVAASVRGIYLGDDRFRPFWAAVEETGAFVFIHPTTRGFSASVFNEYYLWNTVGNPLETTVTAAHLVMAGILEEYPRLKILLAHGGGSVLALRGRLGHAHSFQPFAKANLQESPEVSLKRFYYDTITHDPDLLRALVCYVGPEHVLVGSDYPFDMGDLNPSSLVCSLNLSEEDTEKILAGNVARLIGLDD